MAIEILKYANLRIFKKREYVSSNFRCYAVRCTISCLSNKSTRNQKSAVWA